MNPQRRQNFQSYKPNTGKWFLADAGAREKELRERLEKESTCSCRHSSSGCSRYCPCLCPYGDKLAAWQVVAVRGCKTSEEMYEEARKRWEEMKELNLPVEEDFSVVCTNLDVALCEEKKRQRGREVLAYEEWRKEREEQGLSGWWGEWLREVGEPMKEEEEVDWNKVLAPPPVPEWLLKQQKKEEYEDWEKARKDAKYRRWRNKYATHCSTQKV